MFFSTLLSGAALFHLSIAGYTLQDDYMKDFYNQFEFFTDHDPTNGFVKFVDQATAKSSGLINSTSSGAVSWGVDHTNKAPNGRPSIRMNSKKTYNSGLVVLDVEHMPTGCGTWPAFWMVGPSWPQSGEIDILEGVNEQKVNAMTLHTGPGCSISSSGGGFAGKVETPNCDVDAKGQSKNAGCSIKSDDPKTYGTGLNSNKGGVYATQWTDEAISVYFFPRGSIPKDVLGDSPNPSGWGQPAAKFAGACDIPSIFKQQQIVFDTTFCGDWAGKVWSSGSCAEKANTCEEYVQNNPTAFKEAFWTINALKVYQQDGSSGSPAPSSSAQVPGGPSSTKVPGGPSSTKVPGGPSSTKVPGRPSSTKPPTLPSPSGLPGSGTTITIHTTLSTTVRQTKGVPSVIVPSDGVPSFSVSSIILPSNGVPPAVPSFSVSSIIISSNGAPLNGIPTGRPTGRPTNRPHQSPGPNVPGGFNPAVTNAPQQPTVVPTPSGSTPTSQAPGQQPVVTSLKGPAPPAATATKGMGSFQWPGMNQDGKGSVRRHFGRHRRGLV
ncbi:hypothetical protein GQ43DRAFT_142376 [Delitschia confertaspora ATCC 74209]|uniref:endo-1,3(4)-beta-glucanase n=1 Tax=Delitschia confertaspora ATCC 74209 TaxID=1513339 RepID=A0A9P4MSX7_9PLEO|nr:hypothetical protein GQ43DRAFT_142376 [Delitschia confertaspora ATCC 74209]